MDVTSPKPQNVSSPREPLATSKTEDRSQNARKSSREKSKKTAQKSSKGTEKVVGCMKCLKDVNYTKMLLCDSCDRECHTYCQYPVLWEVPKGEWQCPVCKEELLLKELQQAYMTLSHAKAQHEQLLERQQRSVARLQKSGVLLQNILDDGSQEGRSRRRNRKEINYAELNDFYLPPLSPSELVGRERRKLAKREKSARNMFDYIQEDYLAPRVRSSRRRQFRGMSPNLDVVVEEEEGLGAGKDDQEFIKDGVEIEEEEEKEKEVEEMQEDRGTNVSGGSLAGLSDAAAEEQWSKSHTLLGKRFKSVDYSETDHADHISSNPLSSHSSLSSLHSEKCAKVMRNGTTSMAEVTEVTENLGKSELSRDDSWEEEEEEVGGGLGLLEPWKESEVSASLPQEFLQDPQHSGEQQHRTGVTGISTKQEIQSISGVVERTNLESTLNPERD